MPATYGALKWAGLHWPTYNTEPPFSSFAGMADAPNLDDATPGDTTTGYSMVIGPTLVSSPFGPIHPFMSLDIGFDFCAPVPVSGLRLTYQGFNPEEGIGGNSYFPGGLELHASADGATWIKVAQVELTDPFTDDWRTPDSATGDQMSGGGLVQDDVAFTQEWRYWGIRFNGGQWEVPHESAGFTIADVRLYERTGAPSDPLCTRGSACGGSPVEELPQCSSRTFDADGTDPNASSALWEILDPEGRIIDSGDRYDRFGPLGWGVVYPGLGGAGTLTVTAPCCVPLGSGYEARSAGHSIFFSIVTGACPGMGTPAMSKPIHSTGALYAFPRLGAPTLSRIVIGAPAAAVNPVTYGTDASPATLLDLTYTDISNFQYLKVDLGSAKKVGGVQLRNVTSAAAVAVYVSSVAITDGDFSGATALAAVGGAGPVTALPLLFESAAGVTGRYIYIVPGAALSLGDLELRGPRVPVAYLQNIQPSIGYQEATIRDAPWITQYPVADAQFDPNVTFQCEVASFVPGAAEMLLGAMLDDTGNPITLTANLYSKPLRFLLEFDTQDVAGKKIRWTAYDCVAPGFTWQFNRTSFATKQFVARVYQNDATGVVWRVEVEN